MKACDILFISMSEKLNLNNILSAVAAGPILTVSDIKNFDSAGRIIGFVTVGDKLRFKINLRASQRSKLQVSAQLLKLATSLEE